jgi:tRNA-Thr(GGU) m(6)t(6)A37 methyltransferase TsaA
MAFTSSLFLVVGSSLATVVVTSWYWQRQSQKALALAEARRTEERTGRIRAEVKLRQRTKEQQQRQQHLKQETTETANSGKTTMLLRSIGRVTSPYTKRMGTPRQPQLVPSSRGLIVFTCPAAALDGIQEYSHLWILFEFHANTTVAGASTKTKIRPPRAGGKKVGQLATRSPHRPNCLGLSLVQIESWDAANSCLYIRGLDFVHGTPVYDVKPCVPWDVPTAGSLRVPAWVSQADSLAQVRWTDEAAQSLVQLVTANRLAPLYTTLNQGVDAARQTLNEILAQDPRSSHKGLKVNARGSTVAGQQAYNLVFGQTQIFFRVVGSQGLVQVEALREIDFDPDNFVDGVPLLMAREARNAAKS